MGAEVSGLQLHGEPGPKRRIAPKAVTGSRSESPGTDATDAGREHRTDGRELARYLRGWIGYFGKCETPSVLEGLEEWLRRRLRSAIWKQWKRGPVRFAELRKRGVGKDLAAKTAGSAHGPWRLANSPALNIALPNAYFDSLGIPRLTVRSIAQPAEPPDADPHVRWCDRESWRQPTYVDWTAMDSTTKTPRASPSSSATSDPSSAS
jgi:RNA-directed DNA polymerase